MLNRLPGRAGQPLCIVLLLAGGSAGCGASSDLAGPPTLALLDSTGAPLTRTTVAPGGTLQIQVVERFLEGRLVFTLRDAQGKTAPADVSISDSNGSITATFVAPALPVGANYADYTLTATVVGPPSVSKQVSLIDEATGTLVGTVE